MGNLVQLRIVSSQPEHLTSVKHPKQTGQNTHLASHGTPSESDLLHHFVKDGTQVLQGLDHLGNFLMGSGMVMLGYLLSAQLKTPFLYMLAKPTNPFLYLSWMCVLSWCCAVALLLRFMYWFIFHLLAGRTVHPSQNNPETIGERIAIKDLTYQEFSQKSPDFDTFVQQNYLQQDQTSAQQIWYATFRYTRYMAFRKLILMNKMRSLLGWAMFWSVMFKLTDMGIHLIR